jgi:hypothetical protein
VRPSRTLVLALVLALVAAAGAWQKGWLATAPAPPPSLARSAPERPRFQSPWATEQDWLVDRITRDIRDMASYAAARTPAAESRAVKGDALRIEEHVFSPRTYEAFAREALAAVQFAAARAGASGEDARLLSVLLEPQAGVLVREDHALSRALADAPADGATHERAALLLGAFALRDSAGISTDPRPALIRMTAHLAFARALNGSEDAGLAGRYAETVLATLVGRERDALGRVDALSGSATSSAEKAWLRALRLRNTCDWRIAEKEKKLTLLEALEEYRALVFARDDDDAIAWLQSRKLPPMPEWARRALDASGSVETFNRFTDLALALDYQETNEVLTSEQVPLADPDQFFEALNARPAGSLESDASGKARPIVLGRALWADRFQRNIVFDLKLANSRFWSLGLPGQRKAFAEQVRGRYGRLDLFPIVLRAMADDAASYRVAMAAVRELAIRSPERMTAGHWQLVLSKENFAPLAQDLPEPTTWFVPVLPTGTVFDVIGRRTFTGMVTMRPAELTALRSEAPYDAELAMLAAPKRAIAGTASVTELTAYYGPLADYHARVMRSLADQAWYDPAEFRKRQGALCEFSAEYCFLLGYRLAELGFADEAAVAYQKGFDGSRDRVRAANEIRWLVDYYFDHGEARKAESVARAAAEVYSEGGLFVMARLMERMERLREAEEYYRRIQERYDEGDALVGFYYRRARVDKDASYEARLRSALALALPSGLEPFDRASLPPAPQDGAVFKGANDNTKRYGIQWGNVVVAVDGFRVHDNPAYNVVRALSQSPKMKLVVWRGKSYDEIEVELWDRRFRVDMDSYAASK